MNNPKIVNIKNAYDSKYVKLYEIDYDNGAHYIVSSRRSRDQIFATKTETQIKSAITDAATCIVILKTSDGPRLLLQYEYRYPAGAYILSPPAGLIDDSEKKEGGTLTTARREIFEETGLTVKESDRLYEVSPLLFATPGFTDESNALVCAVLDNPDISSLNTSGTEGTECISGFSLLSKDDAKDIIKKGTDKNGLPYSIFTWAALMYFVSDMWNE